MRQRPILLVLVATTLEISGIGRVVYAQDEPEPENPQRVQAQADAWSRMTDEQFEQWIFGKSIGAACRAYESWLSKEIEAADRRYWLAPDQKRKLEVAGRGDMKRLFDRCEEAKERLRHAGGDLRRIDAAMQELRDFQADPHARLFGEESLFAKTLRKTLNPDQVAAREKNIYRARVEWMVTILDRALGLNAEQHRRFAALLVEETPPLKRYGSSDYDALMWQASRLPQRKLKPIFDEAQYAKLQVRFGQARRMETTLFDAGYLRAKSPDVEPSAETEDAPKSRSRSE